VAAAGTGDSANLTSGYRLAFGVAAAVSLLGVLAAATLLRRPLR
jgi:hypothetical protein